MIVYFQASQLNLANNTIGAQTEAQAKKYVSVLAHTRIKSQSHDVLHENEQRALGTEVLQTGNMTKVMTKRISKPNFVRVL